MTLELIRILMLLPLFSIGIGVLVFVVMVRRKRCGVGAIGGLIWRVMLWGVIVGGVGFVIGIYLPLTIWPHSPQGPLAGILLMAPVGFSCGCLFGIIGWLKVNKRRDVGKIDE